MLNFNDKGAAKKLKFDEKRAVKRLMEEVPHYTREHAVNVVRARRDIDERLHPAFMAWINGDTPKFEYEGFTLDGLKEVTRATSYLQVLLDMDRILKKPEQYIPYYSDKSNFIRM